MRQGFGWGRESFASRDGGRVGGIGRLELGVLLRARHGLVWVLCLCLCWLLSWRSQSISRLHGRRFVGGLLCWGGLGRLREVGALHDAAEIGHLVCRLAKWRRCLGGFLAVEHLSRRRVGERLHALGPLTLVSTACSGTASSTATLFLRSSFSSEMACFSSASSLESPLTLKLSRRWELDGAALTPLAAPAACGSTETKDARTLEVGRFASLVALPAGERPRGSGEDEAPFWFSNIARRFRTPALLPLMAAAGGQCQ